MVTKSVADGIRRGSRHAVMVSILLSLIRVFAKQVFVDGGVSYLTMLALLWVFAILYGAIYGGVRDRIHSWPAASLLGIAFALPVGVLIIGQYNGFVPWTAVNTCAVLLGVIPLGVIVGTAIYWRS